MSSRPCAYVNTSIVLRALSNTEPGHLEARRFLEECCERCRCVWSTVHSREGFRGEITRFFFLGYLASLGAEYGEVDLDQVMDDARRYVDAHGVSPSRLIDTAHLVAANMLGCRFILARDRFIWRHANNFGLVYVNWETHGGRCPCPARTGRSGSQASRSGVRGATRQANSSTSSQTYPATARSAGGPGGSTSSGRKSGSRSKKPRKSSKSSQRKPRRKPKGNAARRKGHRPSKRGPRGSRGMNRA